ncbi:MAG: MgtC/SapB family protein [SAR324 cluster bacterium]|nr:MgtC/SapB family protein [SAR324 cluster bacterium]
MEARDGPVLEDRLAANVTIPLFKGSMDAFLQSMLAGFEAEFFVKLGLALFAGLAIGAERESKGKPAGISTHSYVVGGAMLFTLMSLHNGGDSPTRIAAQIVSGVGFLGAGIILKMESGLVTNLTTAASIWFSAAIGMAIGFGWYVIAAAAIAYSVLVPRIPSLRKDRAAPRRSTIEEAQTAPSRNATGGTLLTLAKLFRFSR